MLKATNSKLFHFEGIRGLCALLVFIVHFWPTAGIAIEDLSSFNNDSFFHRFINEFSTILFNGDLPVYIFWLMSGHVITLNYFRLGSDENTNYLKRATLSRYFRLFIPVFFSSLIAFILIKTGGFYNQSDFSDMPIQSREWLHKWYDFDPSIFHFLKTTGIDVFLNDNCHYNPPLWTISIELFGSYLCYAVLALIGSHQNSLRLYVIVSLALLSAGIMNVSNFHYLAFMLGLMYSHITVTTSFKTKKLYAFINSIYLPVALISISLLVPPLIQTLQPDLNDSIIYFFRVVIRGVGILLIFTNSSALKALLSLKPFVFFGKISFSFYLLHFIILMSLGTYLLEYKIFSKEIIFVLTLLLTFVSSIIFQRLVDGPSIKLSKEIANRF